MKRPTLAPTLVMAVLFGFLFQGIFIQLAESQSAGTILIKPDGSVDGTDKIHRDGDVYTLTGNMSSGIRVQKSYIIVDGAGYTLQGDAEIHGPTDSRGMGLEIVGSKNVTIKNLKIREFTRGIRLTDSSDCRITQNILANNTIGIEMGYVDESYSNNNTVCGNLIKENNAGIRLIYGSSNTISENIITANDEGVSIWGTSGNNVVRNNITNNNRGVYFETSGINLIHHNNFVNNTNDWWDYGLTPWPFQLPFSVTIWDDDIEGNFWDRYNGTDHNGDEIGDTPHELYENNTDRYPLMNTLIIPECPYADESTPPPAEPFPATLVTASVILVAVAILGLFIFLRKPERNKSS